MRVVFLDGTKMVDEASAHAEFKMKLGFPDYYGENYNALMDCLSELIDEDLHIVWHDYRVPFDAIEESAQSFLIAFYSSYHYYPNKRLYKLTILDGPLEDLSDVINDA